AGRWANKGTFDDGGCTLFLQGRDQSLTGSKGGNDIRRVERRVLAECVGGSSDCLLLTWRIGTQGVLHPVAKLRKYGFRHIKRVLRHKVDTDALGADEAHNLLHALNQHLWCVVEQQVRLIEEEYQPGFFRIADLRHFLK